MRVVETFQTLTLVWPETLVRFNLNRLKFFLRVVENISLVWPRLMIVNESWRKLS